MSLMTQANAGYCSDETISALVFNKFAMASPRMPALFNMKGSSTYREQTGSMSGLSSFTAKTEGQTPDEDQPIQQFSKEFMHQEYAKMTRIDRKVYDDDRFDILTKIGNEYGLSAIRTYEEQGAAVFNGAFSSATYKAEDGLSLCNAAHVNVDGGNSQSNSGTSSLSYDNVGATQTLMRNFTDYRGKRIMVEPDTLLVPTALENTALEIALSPGDPTEANLKLNVFSGKFAVITWNYLTDANNWFMIDSQMAMENLLWFWRMPLEIMGAGDAFRGEHKIGAYFRSSHSAIDWRFIYGHNVP